MSARKYIHEWRLSADQTDTGTMGVRIECDGNIYPVHGRHHMTTTRQLLNSYLDTTPTSSPDGSAE